MTGEHANFTSVNGTHEVRLTDLEVRMERLPPANTKDGSHVNNMICWFLFLKKFK